MEYVSQKAKRQLVSTIHNIIRYSPGQLLHTFIQHAGTDTLQSDGLMFTDLVAIGQAMNLVPSVFLHHRLTYVVNIVNQSIGRELDPSVLSTNMQSLQLAHGSQVNKLGEPPRDVLWRATFESGIPHLAFLGPPVTTCYACDGHLQTHNPPTSILCYGLDGPIPALKITLRCNTCGLNYR